MRWSRTSGRWTRWWTGANTGPSGGPGAGLLVALNREAQIGPGDRWSLADTQRADFEATLRPPPPRLDDESRRRLALVDGVPSPMLPRDPSTRSALSAPRPPVNDAPLPPPVVQALALPLPGTAVDPHAGALAPQLPGSKQL